MPKVICTLLIILLSWTLSYAESEQFFGHVYDSVTGDQLDAAQIWTEGGQAVSSEDGSFSLSSSSGVLIVRKPGYLPAKVIDTTPLSIMLKPVIPKALYLSYWAAESHDRREHLIQLLAQTGMNALVIDIKSTRGDIAFSSQLALPRSVGALRARTLKDLPQFLADLKARGIYTIARLAVFKDGRLALGRPDLAVKVSEGEIWTDNEQIAWTDPFLQQVRDYNVDLAEEVAALGFDEIQFDYIRFPARSDLLFAKPNTGDNRVTAINTFLAQAQERLAPYPVMTAANIFGYICWKPKDQKIGQRLVDMSKYVDYLSPMLYPSGFPNGIPGYANPVAHNFEVIAHSLKRGMKLSGLDPLRFRPWLQAFRDYAFDRRSYRADDIHAQINASDQSGSAGWMLWNASSKFSLTGIQQHLAAGEHKLMDVSPKAQSDPVLSRSENPEPALPAM